MLLNNHVTVIQAQLIIKLNTDGSNCSGKYLKPSSVANFPVSMRSFQLLLASLSLATANFSCNKAVNHDVQTPNGKFVGIVDPTFPGVKQWLGVPFAEPPLGPLRFLPPVKKNPAVVVLAQNPPASCQQYLKAAANIFDLVPEFHPPKPYDEDCLYLNVIAPNKPKSERLPVVVWIHGGEFTYGGIETPYEKPHKWVQRSQEHIVVQVK